MPRRTVRCDFGHKPLQGVCLERPAACPAARDDREVLMGEACPPHEHLAHRIRRCGVHLLGLEPFARRWRRRAATREGEAAI